MDRGACVTLQKLVWIMVCVFRILFLNVKPAQFVLLKSALLNAYDEDRDSLRIYFLGKRGREKVEHFGANKIIDHLRDAMIV